MQSSERGPVSNPKAPQGTRQHVEPARPLCPALGWGCPGTPETRAATGTRGIAALGHPPGFPSTWDRASRGAARSAAPRLPVSKTLERGLPAAARSWSRPGTPPSRLFPSGPGTQAAPAGGPSVSPDTWQLTVQCEIRAEGAVAGKRLERTRGTEEAAAALLCPRGEKRWGRGAAESGLGTWAPRV